jgi:membrane associated rhomboid family serine protease
LVPSVGGRFNLIQCVVTMVERTQTSLFAQAIAAAWRLAALLAMLVLMWLSTAVNLLLHGAWLVYGVRAHDPTGFCPNLLFAPFLHAGLAHVLANSVPFAVLGGLVALRSAWLFALVSIAGAVVGAGVVWLLGSPGSVHIGASGLVFTYFGWLIARAVRERSILAIVLGLITLALYGGVLWGLSPFQLGISWQGHLGGLLGGIGAARVWPVDRPRAVSTLPEPTVQLSDQHPEQAGGGRGR